MYIHKNFSVYIFFWREKRIWTSFFLKIKLKNYVVTSFLERSIDTILISHIEFIIANFFFTIKLMLHLNCYCIKQVLLHFASYFSIVTFAELAWEMCFHQCRTFVIPWWRGLRMAGRRGLLKDVWREGNGSWEGRVRSGRKGVESWRIPNLLKTWWGLNFWLTPDIYYANIGHNIISTYHLKSSTVLLFFE